MTDYGERRAYQRGYYAGSRGKWPAHRPPMPPDGIAKDLIAALRSLSGALENYLATVDEDEEERPLGVALDDAQCALARVGRWVRGTREPEAEVLTDD